MVTLSLRLLHILFMATWIGAVFFTSGDVRRTLQSESGPKHLELLTDRVSRNLRLQTLSGLGTIGSGIALIMALGGIGSVPPTIHTGLTIGLLAWGVANVGINGSWRKIQGGLAAGEDAESLAPLLKRMKISGVAFQTLWLIGLVLMVFRHGLA